MTRRQRERIGARIEQLAGRAVPLARVVDTEPPNSTAFREAAAELARIAKECHRLALKTGDRDLITEARKSLEMVSGFGAREPDLSG